MMAGSPVTLLGHHHTCPLADPRQHVGGPVTEAGQDYVCVDGVLVGVVGGTCTCQAGPPDPITEGSSVISIDGNPVARIGDATGHGGRIAEGVSWFTAE